MNPPHQAILRLIVVVAFLIAVAICLNISPNDQPSPDRGVGREFATTEDPSGSVSPKGVRHKSAPEPVFDPSPLQRENSWSSSDLHVRSRSFKLSKDLELSPSSVLPESASERTFVFDLFDDVRLIGQVHNVEAHDKERAVYYGTLDNVPGGDFILAYNEGYIAATFHTPGMGHFQIRPQEDRTAVAMQLDLSRLPDCEASHAPKDSPRNIIHHQSPAELRTIAALHTLHAADQPAVEGGTYNGTGQQGGSGSGLTFTTIDMLMVYTNNARVAAGGVAAIEAIIDATIARTNSAMINSEIGVRLRVVRTEEVNYTSTGTLSSLEDITDGTGVFSNVETWRNASGADLVALLFDGGGGRAWIGNGDPAFGYSVSGISAVESTFTHEIGHNLGCLHDRDNNSITPVYPYSYGWKFTPTGSGLLSTIMGVGTGDRIPYFSNPDVTYMGTATGVPIGESLQSHNAEVIRQTKAQTAAYRSENGNVPPTVNLQSPSYSDPFKALDDVTVEATASDSDGTVNGVQFYRLMSDADFPFSGNVSTSLGNDTASPYARTESDAPAGFWTYAAVAEDNDGAISVDTVSITIAPHYRRTILPLPSGKTSVEITGMNESGRVVGFGHSGNPNATNTRAAYWENGSITELSPLPTHTGAKARAVGQDGVIYGESTNSSGTRRAVKWDNSTTPTNISAVVSGFTAGAALGVDYQNRIYLVDNPYALSRNYRRYDNPGSTTPGINVQWESAANTGNFSTGVDYDFGPGAWRALRWDGSGTQLPPVSGFNSSWGFATNRSGAVFGISSPNNTSWSSSTARLTYWAPGSTTPQNLGTLGTAGAQAFDINDWNHCVGTAEDPTDGGTAVLWKGQGSLIKLPDLLLPLPYTAIERQAQAINNRGQIAGTGFTSSGQYAYFLDPLPGLDHNYWLADHFNPVELEDTTLTNDNANPTGDGIVNLVKRAHGIDPRVPITAAGRAKLPQITLEEDGHLHLRFRRLRTPSDINYTPQVSLTLAAGSWTETLLEQVGITFLDDDYEEVHLRTTFPISQEDRAFVRLFLSR